MEYSVGSLADLISGLNTPNKPKVLRKEFKQKGKKFAKCERDVEARKFQTERKQETKRKITDTAENAPVEVQPKKTKYTLKVDSYKSINKKDKKKLKKFRKSAMKNGSEDSIDGDVQTVEKNDIPTITSIRNPKKKIRKQIENQEHSKSKEISSIIEGHSKRTVFIGNLPININKNILKRKFEKFGTVESVRLRSAPIADERIPKKVAVIKKQFHKDRKSINAYIRFTDRENAVKATDLNGKEYKGHHIRVKLCDDTEKPDQNKAIFLGNVSFDAEEEELWKLFESCGLIESVRLVRDGKTNISKGFGYVNFMSADSVELALQMENVKLRDRELRILACENKKNKKKITSKNRKTDKSNSGDKEIKTVKNTMDFQGKKISDKKKKKLNKGNLQKKKLIKKIAPKTKD